ncbi:MAG: tetratricopeptide repeat protein [Bacteroidota bacterium]
MEYNHDEDTLKKLIQEYEVMSQKGTVRFFEKAAFLDIIAYYEYDGFLDDALEACDHAINQHVASAEFLFHKGRILADLQFINEALGYLEKALSFDPAHFDLNIFYAELLIEVGEFNEAYQILKTLYRTVDSEPQAQVLFLLAKIQEITGDFEKMFFTLKKALQKDPTHPFLLNKIWLAAELAGLYQESLDFHTALIEQHPYSFLAWYNLGQAYYCLEEYTKSAEAFEYTFLINSQFDFAYKDGAEAYIMAGAYEKALHIYDELLDIIEPDSDVYAKIGYCYERLDEVEIARKYYQESLNINPLNSMSLFRMGECFMLEEVWDQAITYYNRAIEADSDREEYLIAIAEAYFKNKNIQQAKLFFQKATEMAPELSRYWTQYAVFLIKMGNNEEAISILDEAQTYTVDTEVLYCKAACLFAMSKREEALQTLSEALRENASLLESLFALTPELKQDSDVRALVKAFK